MEHPILDVLAFAADAAESAGRAGRVIVTLHADGSVSVADDGAAPIPTLTHRDNQCLKRDDRGEAAHQPLNVRQVAAARRLVLGADTQRGARITRGRTGADPTAVALVHVGTAGAADQAGQVTFNAAYAAHPDGYQAANADAAPHPDRTGVGRDSNRHQYIRDEIARGLARPVVAAPVGLIWLRSSHRPFTGTVEVGGATLVRRPAHADLSTAVRAAGPGFC